MQYFCIYYDYFSLISNNSRIWINNNIHYTTVDDSYFVFAGQDDIFRIPPEAMDL
jgi:hypothetical protein